MRLLFLAFSILIALSAQAKPVRLKEVVRVKGVRENPLIGYGLVVGLNGSGDSGGEITNTSLKRMFQTLGLNPQNEVSSNNVAAVIVTAKIPPFARVGQKVDVTVSSIGDANSLSGGTLLITPLKGGDGNVYAVAEGSVSIGGLEQGQKFPNTCLITNGATVEEELDIEFDQKKSIRLSLNNPDFTTAARIEKKINEELGGKYARARDATTVDLIIPNRYQRKVVPMMAILENIRVETDQKANIVINERTGTIVAGGDVRLKPVAISHGDITVQVQGEDGGGEGEGAGRVYYMEQKNSLNDLVKGLNALGASPEDIISIFQALKRSGSLVGEIELI